jgi:predicted CoA-binding protein
MSERKECVVILGASNKADRYAFKAFQMLREYGHTVLPVHPQLDAIEDVSVFADLQSVPLPVDTVTLYIGSARVGQFKEAIIALKPRRVIFNPGTENPELADALSAAGIEPLEACTLVMLRTHQF